MSSGDPIDILISGGGPAGLIAAAAFGAQGHRVLCVDPAPPVTDEAGAGADLRSTAFLRPSVAFLDRIGLWPRLAPHAAPLEIMRIVDAGGAEPKARLVRDFDAGDLGDGPFGWNLPNWLIRREVMARLAELPNVEFRPGTGTAGLIARDDAAFVTLTDGQHLRASLVVAADGRNSPVRQALGIGVKTYRYGQKALAFAVTHEFPHRNVSTEVHRSGGPFTLVPLPDREGRPCSAVVWMAHGPEIARLQALPLPEFTEALNDRSAGILGELTLVTRLTTWPIISQIADRFSAPRVALIAEAAHVVPPIGAQGLNMSLADLAALVDLSAEDPGNATALAGYGRARRAEAQARLTGIDALNRISMAEARPLRDLRAAGLGALHAISPLRRLLMRAGMGGD
ncbi:UbiH/UbiF family hydroxylase [uncultured Paracoccus sp.]|uniref:UbiH/UbiF family hydroxylase n=1 Tax=uncultured Paracoccus sp. TaxID=189685 RepID=UPI0026338C82|nr:UbiH/UbiF family hydroxylase [uncultured Paracoccus sp.]